MMLKPVLLLLALALVTGCTSLTDTSGRRAPVEEVGSDPTAPAVFGPPVQTEPPSPGLTREPLPGSAPPGVRPELPPASPTPASTLLLAVEQAIAANDLDRAAALCERALRISARDGQLWYKLASIRYLQGRYADAQGFAQRALSLAGADAQLQRDSTALLESVKQEL